MKALESGPGWNGWMERLLYFLAAMATASAAMVIFVLAEWLFFMTKPSMFTSASTSRALRALFLAPLPLVAGLLWFQALFCMLGVLLPRRLRGAAVIPGALVLGAALLLLLDNFTYTVFGFGVISTGEYTRLQYVVVFIALVLVAGRWLLRLADWSVGAASVKGSAAVAIVLCAAALPLGASLRLFGDPVVTEAVARAEKGETLAFGRAAEVSEHLPNIMLISVDGIPADRTSLYGYGRNTTPFLEEIREEVLIAENAFANGGRTHGSLTSMLTGKLPITTRVVFPPQTFQGEDSVEHLPGILRGLGYRTAQLGMRHFADAHDAGLIGAFDLANYRWEGEGSPSEKLQSSRSQEDRLRQLEGAEVVLFREAMIERVRSRLFHIFGVKLMVDSYGHVTQEKEDPYWSDKRRVRTTVSLIRELPQPWFIQLHLIDTHCCNRKPRRDVFRAFGSGDDSARFDGEIRDADDDLETIVGTLRSEALLDETVVIVTSDHDASWTTTARLPFLIRFPAAEHAGTIRENVQLIDIAPTILDYIDHPVPPWMEGQSLIAGSLDANRPIFGLSRISSRESAGGGVTRLSEFGPPTYGVVTATLIVGEQLFELWLAEGTTQSSRIENHTAPTSIPLAEDTARDMLVKRLERAGFGVSPPPAERQDAETRGQGEAGS